MRTGVFAGICAAITIVILFLIQVVTAYYSIRIPRSDWDVVNLIIDFGESKLFNLIGFFIILPPVVLLLNPLNQKLRAWRKARGRDIVEEEKYETESGILSLTEKKK